MNKKNSAPISPWFAVGAVACLLIAAAMVAMMVFFARNPAMAPPGILKGVFLTVPAVLLVVIIATMLHYVRTLRNEK